VRGSFLADKKAVGNFQYPENFAVCFPSEPANRGGKKFAALVDGDGAKFKEAERAVNPADFGTGYFHPLL
jgi:hypothetical protein